MSKIGYTPVEIPQGVTVAVDGDKITVTGKEGTLTHEVPSNITVNQADNVLSFERTKQDKRTRAMHGFFRKLVANAVAGVNTPWTKKLEIVGTGFNVKMQGEDFVFKLGYSHPVVFKKVDGLKFAAEGNTKLSVTGIDRQLVGQVAHQIKSVKRPDTYKGKGIRYAGEVVRVKPGKKAKAA